MHIQILNKRVYVKKIKEYGIIVQDHLGKIKVGGFVSNPLKLIEVEIEDLEFEEEII